VDGCQQLTKPFESVVVAREPNETPFGATCYAVLDYNGVHGASG
jgi:hypothetical protein